MSRNKSRKLNRPHQEISSFYPQRQGKSLASRIENWILYGDRDGRDAVQELFPLPEHKRIEVWGD